MSKRVLLLLVVWFSATTSTLILGAQDQHDVGPVPAQLTTAKKVFISNAGIDSKSLIAFQKIGSPSLHYDKFYAAMKSWGRYELVSAPADADLVFELRSAVPLVGCQPIDSYEPQLALSILDSKTHFILWTLNVPMQGAYRKGTFVKNLDEGITALMDHLKALSTAPKK